MLCNNQLVLKSRSVIRSAKNIAMNVMFTNPVVK